LFVYRSFEDLLVGGAGSNLCNGEHIMTGLTERLYDGSDAALVREEVHTSRFRRSGCIGEKNNFFMCHGGGTVSHSGADILGFEVGVVLKKLGYGGTLSKLSQDDLDRDASSANHGFALHHGRIDLDSLRGHT
jgi:hypothetical protein